LSVGGCCSLAGLLESHPAPIRQEVVSAVASDGAFQWLEPRRGSVLEDQGFYKRSGKWCSYCDSLQKKADETLVQITSVNFKASKSWLFFELIPTDSLY
jgi:hypothetical protein